jgi:RNA polymerase sigma factor (TIGR02999 family)
MSSAMGSNSTVSQNAGELLPLVYEELRRIAAVRLAHEKPGQTLDPTALVHEAWLRLATHGEQSWPDSRHFFFAAATAMRRILIENARRKARLKHGGGLEQVELTDTALAVPLPSEDLLALDEALERFSQLEPQAARLVELRYFGGLQHQEAAEMLGITRREADRLWAFARAWLLTELRREPGETRF